MLNPVEYLQCRREHLIGLLRSAQNAEDVMAYALKIENIEYEISRAYH